MRTAVLCAVRGPEETHVVRALGAAGSGVTVTRRCADLPELLGSAAAGLGTVAVVSADFAGVDRDAVQHLHDSGVLVVGVTHPGTGWTVDRARALGVDRVVDAADVEHEILVAVLDLADAAAGRPRPDSAARAPGLPPLPALTTDRDAVPVASSATAPSGASRAAPNDGTGRDGARSVRAPGPRPPSSGPSASRAAAARSVLVGWAGRGPASGRRQSRTGSPGAPRGDAPVAGAGASPAGAGTSPAPDDRGAVIAVWGPTGAPGRTTLALNLAAELADQGALLVDADTYGGTVAQMLGLLDEAPGVAAAARAAATGRLDVRALAALTPSIEGGLRVLTGVSRPDRWPEVTATGLEVVWACARQLARWTVVDCGFSLEQDEALSYDTRAPHRNAATFSAIGEADVVVVVGSGDPIGLQRLVRALGDLSDRGVPDEARRVVVNRVRASASGSRPGEAIAEALRRYAGVAAVHLVPEDRPACDGAVLNARTLREHAPSSPTRTAIAALAGAFVPERTSLGAH